MVKFDIIKIKNDASQVSPPQTMFSGNVKIVTQLEVR